MYDFSNKTLRDFHKDIGLFPTYAKVLAFLDGAIEPITALLARFRFKDAKGQIKQLSVKDLMQMTISKAETTFESHYYLPIRPAGKVLHEMNLQELHQACKAHANEFICAPCLGVSAKILGKHLRRYSYMRVGKVVHLDYATFRDMSVQQAESLFPEYNPMQTASEQQNKRTGENETNNQAKKIKTDAEALTEFGLFVYESPSDKSDTTSLTIQEDKIPGNQAQEINVQEGLPQDKEEIDVCALYLNL